MRPIVIAICYLTAIASIVVSNLIGCQMIEDIVTGRFYWATHMPIAILGVGYLGAWFSLYAAKAFTMGEEEETCAE